MSKIEILAPCGSFESVVSAVRSGADAVYLGAKDFSARASAENFDYFNLKEAVDYCHTCGVKVYLTINTIVFDSELEKAKEVIIEAAKAKVDAVIVQNIGVATLVKNLVPTMAIHASTQMSVHSVNGVLLLQEMGFKRVVLSRELSKEEIKNIADNTDIELEVFVHGALCMSVSGQCYFSAMLGGRSGNRGRCAQPCRLPFSVDGNKGFDLSLKDNSIINYINELQQMGVASAKIEGRMKRPEYVATATKACVEVRDQGFVSNETQQELADVFSRTGFTDGYYNNCRGNSMFGYRQKEDVVSATNKLFAKIRQEYKDEKPRVNLQGEFTATIGEKAQFTVFYQGKSVTVYSDMDCQKAINKPLEKQRVLTQLTKTGGTPFFFERIALTGFQNISLPVSAVNDMRRKALDLISHIVKNKADHTVTNYQIPEFVPHKATSKKIYTRSITTDLGKGFKEADLCFVPLFSQKNELKRLIEQGYKIGVEIPRSLFARENKVEKALAQVKELGIKDVLCNNLGAVYLCKKENLTIHGGFGLNFVNTLDLLWAEKMGFADTELSFELTFSDIEKLGGNLPRGIISYGYLPLMLTRNCPNKSKNISCNSCSKQGKMKDRLNKSFIFYCDGECTEVLNCACVDVLEQTENSTNLDFTVFRFSVENYVEKVENILDFTSKTLKSYEKTHGLYLRGVK